MTQPAAFWLGVEQFNQREFYACHDTLEALWIEADLSDKQFYQGILQIAVALYHLGNQNWRGAVILLGEGMNRLRNYQPDHGEIDVESFLTEVAQIVKLLQQTGPEQVASVIELLGYGLHQSDGVQQPDGRSAIALPRLQKISLSAD